MFSGREDIPIVKFERGSRAYGTENENSDNDTTTIFLEDIYTKALLYRKYKHKDRFLIDDDAQIELGMLMDRIFAGDTAFLENCFRDLVIQETPYTELYFELMDELIQNDLFNPDILKSRANKHFGDETKRIKKILGHNNIEKSQKLLYQNMRVEKLLVSIIEGTPKLKYTGKDLEELKNYKYGNFTKEELLKEVEDFHGRWKEFPKITPIESRDKKLDSIYVEYLRKFDELYTKLNTKEGKIKNGY